MDDDKIKTLFDNFEPELPPSFQFMERLKRNMEAVEIVRQHNAALKKRNKLAVAIAAICGLAMGIALTLIFPLLGDWIGVYNVSLPRLQIHTVVIDYSFFAWAILAAVSTITALNAYEIALAKLSPKS